ncbi:MAG: NAD(P)-binding domain-containing protein [Acidobacteria bacterium]|nr:NAD(P)-binding domain-containing protein [Acidobacteriota bacterium]
MKYKTAGFIGGGRVARIILGGLNKAGSMPGSVVVGDTNPDAIKRLQLDYPEIRTTADNTEAAGRGGIHHTEDFSIET